MLRPNFRLLLVVSCLAMNTLFAQTNPPQTYPPKLQGATVETYQTINGVALNLYVFEPAGAPSAAKSRPAIVFFFGGGWRNGNPAQFEQQCRHFASRGMVAITVDYRVGSRHGTKADDSVRDARAAIRWVRENAKRLRIDPARIVAAGGSAGGHLAAATGIIVTDDPRSRPNALVLFNPVLVLAPIADATGAEFKSAELAGIDLAAISPYHHAGKGAPPTIIFHGKADTTVPYLTAELFAKKMEELENRCELVGYEGANHGFFNYGRNENRFYRDTVQKADAFLTSLGYLQVPR